MWKCYKFVFRCRKIYMKKIVNPKMLLVKFNDEKKFEIQEDEKFLRTISIC